MSEFYPSSDTRCKLCCLDVAKKDYQNNKSKRDGTSKAWKARNPEQYALTMKRLNLKKCYGMTIEAHTAMLQVQFYKCAACGDKFDPEAKLGRACVDHDHDTGAVRELLCGSCNLSLGYAKEDISRLEKLIAYLKRHGK